MTTSQKNEDSKHFTAHYKRLLKLKDFNGKIEDALNKRLVDPRYSWPLKDVLSQEASIRDVREALLETQYGAVLVRIRETSLE